MELGDGATELLALLGVVDREVVCTRRESEGHGAGADALRVVCVHQVGETPAEPGGREDDHVGTDLHVLFEDMEVGPEMVVMPPSGLRRGFADLMNAYNSQRVGAGTVALGIATGAYELAIDFSKQREQFERPIAEFQGLQWMLADMSIQLSAARALIHQAAADPGEGGFPDVTVAAQAKVFAADMAVKVTNDALQVFGAAGYSRGNPLERMVRDARMFTIGGGTAQILRTVIASRLLGRKLPQTRDGYLNLARAGE